MEVSRLANAELIPNPFVMSFKTGLTEVMPGLRLNAANISAKRNNLLRLLTLITSVEFLKFNAFSWYIKF